LTRKTRGTCSRRRRRGLRPPKNSRNENAHRKGARRSRRIHITFLLPYGLLRLLLRWEHAPMPYFSRNYPYPTLSGGSTHTIPDPRWRNVPHTHTYPYLRWGAYTTVTGKTRTTYPPHTHTHLPYPYWAAYTTVTGKTRTTYPCHTRTHLPYPY
jgi:hypothetical protein